MNRWQTGKPPNETLVEVEDDQGRIVRARAIWGRDGTLPHWQSENADTRWHPSAFGRWRKVPTGEEPTS